MNRVLNSIVAGALATGMTFSMTALAADGTIVAAEEDKYIIEGADGNTYEITDLTVVAEDLKTGDMVEYEVVEGKVMGVKKK